VFTVQADSHLDENTSGEVYLRTLANALADQPDLHFALGDAFMTGKYVEPELSHPQYLAQRYYLGHLCHSAALYFTLGNHDGESGNRGSNIWATMTRKRYLPNPFRMTFTQGMNNANERSVWRKTIVNSSGQLSVHCARSVWPHDDAFTWRQF
jgi:hypothetical protein